MGSGTACPSEPSFRVGPLVLAEAVCNMLFLAAGRRDAPSSGGTSITLGPFPQEDRQVGDRRPGATRYCLRRTWLNTPLGPLANVYLRMSGINPTTAVART